MISHLKFSCKINFICMKMTKSCLHLNALLHTCSGCLYVGECLCISDKCDTLHTQNKCSLFSQAGANKLMTSFWWNYALWNGTRPNAQLYFDWGWAISASIKTMCLVCASYRCCIDCIIISLPERKERKNKPFTNLTANYDPIWLNSMSI